MSQKCYQFFFNERLKKISHFFTSILPNYVPHEITKEFWKNNHFENMTAGFLLRYQNLLLSFSRSTGNLQFFSTFNPRHIMSGELNYSLTSPVEITCWNHSFQITNSTASRTVRKRGTHVFPPPSNTAATGPFRCVI